MRATHVAADTLSAYLDEELSGEERARVASHLETCDQCRGRFRGLRVTVEMVRDLDPLLAPEGLREAVGARLSGAGTPRAWSLPGFSRWRPSWRLTGAAVAVILVGLFTLNLLRTAAPPGLDWRGREPEVVGGLRPPAGTDLQPASPSFGQAPKVADQTVPPTLGGPLVLRRVIRTGSLFIEVRVVFKEIVGTL